MRLLLPLLAAVSMLAGCGGSGGGAAQTRGLTATVPVGQSLLVVTAPPGAPHFDKATYRVRSGRVAIALRNLSAVRHNIAIRGNGVDTRGAIVSAGKTSVVSVSLRPGMYVLYCPLDGHDKAGMHARLIVAG